MVRPWLDPITPVTILCGRGSKLTVDGDFHIGAGTRLALAEGAELYIGGCRNEPLSGITEGSTILVSRRVHVGVDLLCAWNVFITDSDWHGISGQSHQLDTIIGDHVWVATGVHVLKGCQIGDGSILACGTVAHKVLIPANSLAGGTPCRVIAAGRTWSREVDTSGSGEKNPTALEG